MGAVPVHDLITKLRQAGRESRQLVVLGNAVSARIKSIDHNDSIDFDKIVSLLDRYDLAVDELVLINDEIVGEVDKLIDVITKSMESKKW